MRLVIVVVREAHVVVPVPEAQLEADLHHHADAAQVRVLIEKAEVLRQRRDPIRELAAKAVAALVQAEDVLAPTLHQTVLHPQRRDAITPLHAPDQLLHNYFNTDNILLYHFLFNLFPSLKSVYAFLCNLPILFLFEA